MEKKARKIIKAGLIVQFSALGAILLLGAMGKPVYDPVFFAFIGGGSVVLLSSLALSLRKDRVQAMAKAAGRIPDRDI
jgi:hypothetical protein